MWTRATTAIAMLMLAGGCASTADAPSLEPRAIEQRSDAERVDPPIAPIPADAALTGKIASILGTARAGEADFAKAASQSATLSRDLAAAPASEAWIVAQTRLSALEASRRRTSEALAELDTLLVDAETRAAAGNDPGGIEALRDARVEVAAMVEHQEARYAELTR